MSVYVINIFEKNILGSIDFFISLKKGRVDSLVMRGEVLVPL